MHNHWMAATILIALLAVASDDCIYVHAMTPKETADTAKPSTGTWGIDLSDRDPAVKPGDDFYMSQNGAWFARTELSKDRPNAAYWRDVRTLARARMIAILQAAAADKQLTPDTPAGKAAAFYRAYSDDAAIEARGVSPLKPQLDAIRAATTREQMARLMGTVAGSGTNRSINVFARPLGLAIWGVDVAQDTTHPTRYAVYLHQGGLLLPGPEFYLDQQLADVRAAYQKYVARMLELVGWSEPDVRAGEILAFETRVARVTWSHEQMNDVIRTNNPMTVAELVRFAPNFDWRAFLAGAELPDIDKVNIDAREAFPKIAAIFADTALAILQARQAFAVVDANADVLGAAVVQENFKFRTQMLAGQGGVAPATRATRAEFAIGTHLDEAAGSMYVARHFSPQAKARVLEMTENLRHALDRRLAQSTWLAHDTKATARDKLAKMLLHIGYPEHPQDYKGLQISDTDAYGDMQRSAAYKWRQQIRRLNQPFLRTEWALTANYPNYSYQTTTNTLEIPAALLQPPFFDINADAAVDYGSMGALIGEVMMMAFDPQGQNYDADGRLREWWSSADVAYFDAQAHKLSAQYSAIEPLPGLHMKGDLVISESIDDLGGLLIALDAYHTELHNRPAAQRDGFSGDQRFFLGRAQMWRAKFGTNFIRNQVATGVNSPPFLRVNGPIRNMDAWYAAFDVKPGDKLHLAPDERVRIW